MKRKIKKTFKLLSAIFLAVILIGLAGLWRLSLYPVEFHRDSPVLRYVPKTIRFSKAFLTSGRFYTIPEVELRDVSLELPTVQMKASKLFATWNLWDLLWGDLNISLVRIKDPEVIIKTNPGFPPQDDGVDSEALGLQLRKLFSYIPMNNLDLIGAKISFSYKGRCHKVTGVSLSLSKFSKRASFQLSGFWEEGVSHPFEFKARGRVQYGSDNVSGEVVCNRVLLEDLPIPQSFKQYAKFYKDPLSFELVFNVSPNSNELYFNGKVKLSALDFPSFIFLRGEQQKTGQIFLEIGSPQISIEVLPKIWPPAAEGIRNWVLESVFVGTGRNIKLNFSLQKEGDKDFILKDMKGELDVEDASILYKKGLPLLEKASGHVSFDKEKSSISIRKGYLKDLRVESSNILLLHLQETIHYLKGTINFRGPLRALVWYMRHDFLKKKLPSKMKAETGQVEGSIFLSLPLKEKLDQEDIVVDINSVLKKGFFSFQNSGHELVVKEANLLLNKKKDVLKIEGTGDINGFKSSILWEEDDQPNAQIKTRKKVKGLGEFKGLLDSLPAFLQGHVQTPKGGEALLSFIAEEDKEGSKRIELDLDLEKSSVFIPLLNWRKTKGVPAKVEIDIETRNNRINRFRKLCFLSTGLKLQGNAKLDDQGKVSEIHFHPFLITDVKGEGRVLIKDGIWLITARIPYLNFSSLINLLKNLDSKSKEETVPLDLNLQVNTLFFNPNYAYKKLEVDCKLRNDRVSYLKILGYDQDSPFFVQYYPNQENMALEVEIPRLETILEGLGISDQIKSKKVTIQASKPLNDLERPIKGKLFIEELKVMNAPFFAKLLSLISIEGLVRTLSGSGLMFNDSYAKFEYKDQKIALRRARIMNSSIGITTQGYVDFKKNRLDLEGVLVPANFLNQLLGKIPLIGTILTGGKDQGLFSVSYTAKGSFKKPEIKSNPLGIVAPNILKSLFSDLTGTRKPKPTLVEFSEKS